MLGRDGDHGQVHLARHIVDVLVHGPAGDGAAFAVHQVDLARDSRR